MTAYLGFSDDAGIYKKKPNQRVLDGNPYFIRALLLIDTDSWKYLRDKYSDTKKSYELPSEKEIKWSYLGSIMSHRRSNKPITPDKDYYFLKDYPLEKLKSFYESSCKLLCDCQYCKVVLTVTYNKHDNSAKEPLVHSWHVQNIMQRIEMEIQGSEGNLASLHFDTSNYDSEIRDAYSTIYKRGDFIQKYNHLRDSMSIEQSHQSIGIQVADHTAGVFNSYLKGHAYGGDLFKNYIFKLLRRDPAGKLLGVGITNIPTNDTVRKLLEKRLTIDGLL